MLDRINLTRVRARADDDDDGAVDPRNRREGNKMHGMQSRPHQWRSRSRDSQLGLRARSAATEWSWSL